MGFTFHGKELVWHASALQQFKYRVKEITGRSRGVSMERKVVELTVYLRGWINYFAYMDVGEGREQDAEASG